MPIALDHLDELFELMLGPVFAGSRIRHSSAGAVSNGAQLFVAKAKPAAEDIKLISPRSVFSACIPIDHDRALPLLVFV